MRQRKVSSRTCDALLTNINEQIVDLIPLCRPRCSGRYFKRHSRDGSWRGSRGIANRLDQLGVGALHAPRLSLEPLRFTEEVLERRSQRGGIDAQCDNRALLGRSTLDLSADVRGGDGTFGQHQYEDLSCADRANDRVRVERSGFYVARRDPAPDS